VTPVLLVTGAVLEAEALKLGLVLLPDFEIRHDSGNSNVQNHLVAYSNVPAAFTT